jgi:hypothetical protein
MTKSGHKHAKNDGHKNKFLPHSLSPPAPGSAGSS